MKTIQKIAIIGNCGSGKSTLAPRLHTIFNLPVYHLDHYYWKPGWIEREPTEYEVIHKGLCDKDEWIIDGMNMRVLEYRIQKADTIIVLDIPRFICVYRIIKRTLKYYGTVRPLGPHGCPERFDWEFIKFLKWVVINFKKKNYPAKINEFLVKHGAGKQIYILKSQQEIDSFLKEIKRIQ